MAEIQIDGEAKSVEGVQIVAGDGSSRYTLTVELENAADYWHWDIGHIKYGRATYQVISLLAGDSRSCTWDVSLSALDDE